MSKKIVGTNLEILNKTRTLYRCYIPQNNGEELPLRTAGDFYAVDKIQALEYLLNNDNEEYINSFLAEQVENTEDSIYKSINSDFLTETRTKFLEKMDTVLSEYKIVFIKIDMNKENFKKIKESLQEFQKDNKYFYITIEDLVYNLDLEEEKIEEIEISSDTNGIWSIKKLAFQK